MAPFRGTTPATPSPSQRPLQSGTERERGGRVAGIQAHSAEDMALLERLENLYVAVIADCLDSVGVRDNLLAPRVRALAPGSSIAGFALTVQVVAVDAVPADRAHWYAGELAAVDAQQPGDVLVVSSCDGSFWGELLATASRFRGSRGLVGDCLTRDTAALIAMRFPTFVTGSHAYDSLGRLDVTAFGVAVECAGVTVHPRDLVIGDDDGVAIIPRALAGEVIRLAEEKVAGENVVRDRLAEGMSATDAFRTYGVL
jgi:4-hydroxy-4-methyl-2-oxoglutarate aldolase